MRCEEQERDLGSKIKMNVELLMNGTAHLSMFCRSYFHCRSQYLYCAHNCIVYCVQKMDIHNNIAVGNWTQLNIVLQFCDIGESKLIAGVLTLSFLIIKTLHVCADKPIFLCR